MPKIRDYFRKGCRIIRRVKFLEVIDFDYMQLRNIVLQFMIYHRLYTIGAISVLYFNARSLLPKIEVLRALTLVLILRLIIDRASDHTHWFI